MSPISDVIYQVIFSFEISVRKRGDNIMKNKNEYYSSFLNVLFKDHLYIHKILQKTALTFKKFCIKGEFYTYEPF